jgi:hypothetical protein
MNGRVFTLTVSLPFSAELLDAVDEAGRRGEFAEQFSVMMAAEIKRHVLSWQPGMPYTVPDFAPTMTWGEMTWPTHQD